MQKIKSNEKHKPARQSLKVKTNLFSQIKTSCLHAVFLYAARGFWLWTVITVYVQ